MGSLTPVLLLALAASPSGASSEPPFDPNVVLRVSIASDEREFHIGETIPIQLSFSSAVKDRYHVNLAHYDRSGRMEYERFRVAPARGAVDPLADRPGGIGGGLTTYKFLGAEPSTIALNLNEWLRFTRPGEYRLSVTSRRVGRKDPSTAFGESPVTARGDPIKLRIVPATRAWQRAVFDQAVASLEKPRSVTPQELQPLERSRRQALETLRFLGTPDALRELAKRMRGEDPGGGDHICMMGLLYSLEPDAARRALDDALVDPDHPIAGPFLFALQGIRSAPEDRADHWREDQQKALEELVAVLPTKRGEALPVSLSTAVTAAWNGAALPKESLDTLVQQLVSVFDQLPEQQQTQLLTYGWDKMAGPTLLPIVRRYAQAYRDFPNMRGSPAYESLQLSEKALGRWYELDPSGARLAIIKEITRPRPRFDARVLGVLPEATLPEVEGSLADHFIATDEPEASARLASLIARYATDAILPEVLGKLDGLIGKWACASQDPILAYVLRVSPAQARPRLERAMAARGEGFTGCNRYLLRTISEIHYDPMLEEIGIQSLADPDPQVATTAATMLGRFGSTAAERALWERYASWSAQWKGREGELAVLFAEGVDDRIYQLGRGESLMQALATGTSWLLDETGLQRLSRMTSVQRLRDSLDRHVKAWEQRPLGIALSDTGPPLGFRAQVAQYELHDMGALEEKLSQFPSGTEFVLRISPPAFPASDEAAARVRAFLGAHGMVVAGESASP